MQAVDYTEQERKEYIDSLAEQNYQQQLSWKEEIKESTTRNTTIPWEQESRKISRIIDFFYKSYLRRQEQRFKSRRRYIYRLDIIQKEVRRKKLKYRFVSLRLIRLFYITISYRQFRQLARAMRSKAGLFEENYLLALEGRLSSYLYRTSLVANPFQCIQLVQQGQLLVNFKQQRYITYRVPLHTLVTFTGVGKRIIYLTLMARLAKRRSLFNPPRYMFVSYSFLFSYMKRPPRQADLVFPVAIDIYRASGYAF